MLGQNMAFSDVLMLFNESRGFISREIVTIKSKLMEHGKALTGHPCERAGFHQLVAGGNRSTRQSQKSCCLGMRWCCDQRLASTNRCKQETLWNSSIFYSVVLQKIVETDFLTILGCRLGAKILAQVKDYVPEFQDNLSVRVLRPVAVQDMCFWFFVQIRGWSVVGKSNPATERLVCFTVVLFFISGSVLLNSNMRRI